MVLLLPSKDMGEYAYSVFDFHDHFLACIVLEAYKCCGQAPTLRHFTKHLGSFLANVFSCVCLEKPYFDINTICLAKCLCVLPCDVFQYKPDMKGLVAKAGVVILDSETQGPWRMNTSGLLSASCLFSQKEKSQWHGVCLESIVAQIQRGGRVLCAIALSSALFC